MAADRLLGRGAGGVDEDVRRADRRLGLSHETIGKSTVADVEVRGVDLGAMRGKR